MPRDSFSLRDLENRKREINASVRASRGEDPLSGKAEPASPPPSPFPAPVAPPFAHRTDYPEMEEGIHLKRYTEIVSHYKWVVFFVAVSVFGLIMVKSLTAEKKYSAKTHILFKADKSSPFARFASLKGGNSLTIDAVAFIGKTSEVMNAVKRRLNLSLSEDELKSMIIVKPDYNSNILHVTVLSNEPDLSRNIANTFADVFIENNRKLTRLDLSKTTKILLKQMKKTAVELQGEEESLRAFQDQTGLVSIDAGISLKMRKVNDLNDRIEKIKTQLLAQEVKIQLLKDRLKHESPSLLANTRIAKPLHQRLVALEIQLAESLSLHKEKHPEVQNIRKNIASIKQLIRQKLEDQVKIETFGRNPFRDKLVRDIVTMNIETTSLKARKKGLEKILEKENLALKEFPESKIQYLRIKRKLSAIERIYMDLQRKYEQNKIAEESVAGQLVQLQPALEAELVGQSEFRVAILGLLVGIVMGTGLAFILEYWDNTVKSLKDLKDLGINVLGFIPDYKKGPVRIDWKDPNRGIAEHYRIILNNLRYTMIDRKSAVIMVTSATKWEGKTTNLINMAISSALHGKKIIIVDCDIRKSGLSRFFGIKRVHEKAPFRAAQEPRWYRGIFQRKRKGEKQEASPENLSAGLTDYLAEEVPWKEMIRETRIPGISLIPSGTWVMNPFELLSTARMKDLISELRGQADMIFIDAPPVIPVADAMVISSLVDGVIYIARSRYLSVDAARMAMERLTQVQSNVIGGILTFADLKHLPYKYQDYTDED